MKPSVLIVDDLPFMRELIREIVTDAGFTVVAEAADGREALARYLAFEPDVVLLDIVMPEMDGLVTLKKLRILDPGARVVMCSALGEQEMIVRSIQLGARDFVIKPFQPERVTSALTKVLQRDSLL